MLVRQIAWRNLATGAGGPDKATKAAAAVSVALSLGGVAGGKLLLYTNSMLMTTDLDL